MCPPVHPFKGLDETIMATRSQMLEGVLWKLGRVMGILDIEDGNDFMRDMGAIRPDRPALRRRPRRPHQLR